MTSVRDIEAPVPAFRVETLDLDRIRQLYTERVARDFPPDEIKPFSRIEKALSRGEYVCYGATDGGRILGYAFFVITGRQALFDYFAVDQSLRGRGIGSRFIRALIGDTLAGMACVLLEVDDPDGAKTSDEEKLRRRRLAFYLRNGLRDTGVRAKVYGVRFRILWLPIGEEPAPEAVRRVYSGLYHAILPPALYSKWVVMDEDRSKT